MTLGERILLKRKEIGLSQEDLGNMLNVSRQTVYKWESDQAIPELGNLISLAKIFKVSVGWLIAEESSENNAAAYDEVAEKIFVMIRDREKSKEPPKKKKTTIIFAGLLAVLFVFSLIKFNTLDNKYQELNHAIDRNNAYVHQQVNSIVSSVSSMLSNYNSITLNSDAILEKIDFDKNTISINMNALPKTYVKGMEAVFHIAVGNNVYDIKGTAKNDKSFFAVAEIPLINDEASVSVEFINGDVSESINIAVFYDLLSGTFPYFDIALPLGTVFNDNYTGFTNQYFEIIEQNVQDFAFHYGADFKCPKIVSMQAFLTEDGVKIADYVYDKEFTEKINGTTDYPNVPQEQPLYVYWHNFRHPDDIKLTKGKTYAEHFIATDEYGRSVELVLENDNVNVIYHID